MSKKKQKKIIDWKCPECHHTKKQFKHDHIRAETYCYNCGLVLQGMNQCGIIYPDVLPVYERVCDNYYDPP